MKPNVLSIAGLDPSGGAGILADAKTFGALGCHGMAALTAGTVQNTQGVSGVFEVANGYVGRQIEALFADSDIAAVKIGMVYDARVIDEIVQAFEVQQKMPPVVLDPVMVAQSGDRLMNDNAVAALKKKLIPLSALVTPNIPEAEVLLGQKFAGNMKEFAARLMQKTGRPVLLKGGHLEGVEAIDVLAHAGEIKTYAVSRVQTQNNHGTGCTLSSAIAAYLALGNPLPDAVRGAKEYLTEGLKQSHQLRVGKGPGPVDHFYAFRES